MKIQHSRQGKTNITGSIFYNLTYAANSVSLGACTPIGPTPAGAFLWGVAGPYPVARSIAGIIGKPDQFKFWTLFCGLLLYILN